MVNMSFTLALMASREPTCMKSRNVKSSYIIFANIYFGTYYIHYKIDIEREMTLLGIKTQIGNCDIKCPFLMTPVFIQIHAVFAKVSARKR